MPRRAATEPITNQDLEKLCALWRKRLRLQDWKKIDISFTEMENDDGQCTWDCDRRIAEIRIRPQNEEVEQTVVHELVHIKKDGHKEYEGHNTAEEVFINDLSDALVDAYRGHK